LHGAGLRADLIVGGVRQPQPACESVLAWVGADYDPVGGWAQPACGQQVPHASGAVLTGHAGKGSRMPRKIYAAGDILTAADMNAVAMDPLTAEVAADETTTSASYVDLTTAGPVVGPIPLNSGQTCLVTAMFVMSSASVNTTAGYMSFAVSGTAGTLAAADANAAVASAAVGELRGVSRSTLFVASATGSATFTGKYKSGVGGTVMHFQQRRLIVVVF
jgi:hypothetical protein